MTVVPHWVNASLLMPLARPFVRVDGDELIARWKHPLELPVVAGKHLVETFIRYRGFNAELGTGKLTLEVQPGEDLEVVARNGWANHMPFVPQLVPTGSWRLRPRSHGVPPQPSSAAASRSHSGATSKVAR